MSLFRALNPAGVIKVHSMLDELRNDIVTPSVRNKLVAVLDASGLALRCNPVVTIAPAPRMQLQLFARLVSACCCVRLTRYIRTSCSCLGCVPQGCVSVSI